LFQKKKDDVVFISIYELVAASCVNRVARFVCCTCIPSPVWCFS
jgi:hypothetical protein